MHPTQNDCELPKDWIIRTMNKDELEDETARTMKDEMIVQPAQNGCELPNNVFGDDPVESLQPALNCTNLTNDICRDVEQANEWSSTVIVPHGIDHLDISYAAMGASSSTPIGATKQPFDYPRWGASSSVYRFDPDLYNEISWSDLQSMLTKVGCVSGCRLNACQVWDKRSHFWNKSYELWCSHGVIMKNKGSSMFIDDSVSPSNVTRKERLKRVKSKGATRGNVYVLVGIFCIFNTNWHILFCIILTRVYNFV